MVVGKGGNQLVGGDSKRLFPNLFIISVDFKKASCFLPERWVISFPRTFLFSRKQGKSRTRLSPYMWAAFWCMMLPSLGVGGRGTEADKIRGSLASDSDSEWMSPLNTHTTESHFSVTHYLLFIFPAKYGEDTDAHSLCLEVSCTICCKDKYMRAFISLLLLLPFRQLEKNLVLFWSSSSLVCLNGEEGRGRGGGGAGWGNKHRWGTQSAYRIARVKELYPVQFSAKSTIFWWIFKFAERNIKFTEQLLQ